MTPIIKADHGELGDLRGPERTLVQLADWLTENARLIDAMFSAVTSLKAVCLAEHMSRQHPTEQSQRVHPVAGFRYEFSDGRSLAEYMTGYAEQHSDLPDMRSLRSVRAFKGVTGPFGELIRQRCVLSDDLYYGEVYALDIQRDGNCRCTIRPWDFSSEAETVHDATEQFFQWVRGPAGYAGQFIELRLWGPFLPAFLAEAGQEQQALRENPALICESEPVVRYRELGFRPLFLMRRAPDVIKFGPDHISVTYSCDGAQTQTGRESQAKPGSRRRKASPTTAVKMPKPLAWSVHKYWREREDPRYKVEWGNVSVWDRPNIALWTQGQRVSGEDVPARLRVTSSHVQLPELFLFPSGNVWVVSERFRELVEAREPGLHQFFPLEVTMKNGAAAERVYFLFNICQSLPLIEAEVFVEELGLKARLAVFDRRKAEGKHAWRWSQKVYFSDQLKVDVERLYVAGMEFEPVRLVEPR